MSKDVECPYCGVWQEINHDDGYGFEEDVIYEQQCSDCDKYFVYTIGILYVYDANEADCLNGSDHDYKPTITYPKEYTRMRCTICDEEREMTDTERLEHGI